MIKKKQVDQNLIKSLASILNETDLSEIEIEQEGMRIRICRNCAPQNFIMSPGAVPMPAPMAAEAPAPASALAPALTPKEEAASNLNAVT